ncbi:MAG: tetratricopeptide repeat protein [Bacteroidales bacterium]|nr:tetratricopeptide repeat protein [Bacteroidales bacterium]
MKKILLILSLSLFTSYSISAQKIHSFSEIMKMMTNSPVNYQVELLKNPAPVPDRNNKVNYNDVYREVNGTSIRSYKYSIPGNVKPIYDEAEKDFSNNKILKARELYQKVLSLDSSLYQVITYIGQTYEMSGNYEEAMKWYRQAIDKNYIDYMAHWFLADAYMKKGEVKKAVDEITMAQILNRNNVRIHNSLKRIYQAAKMDTTSWTFNPQMKIDSIGVNKVEIASDKLWLPYALVTAFWKFELKYSKSMGVEKGQLSTTQSKEALAALIGALKKKDYRKNPELRALQLAISNKLVTEYILYEIWLPQYPQIAYQFSKSTLNDLRNYVISIRGGKKLK